MQDGIVRIVIADDNRLFCQSLKHSLERYPGLDVIGIAGDGQEAVDSVKRLLPDLLVLDIIMPHLDGLGVLEQLRESKLERMPRVIVLSGMGQDAIASLALSLGADYFMLKPFDMDIFVKRIRDLMNDRIGALARTTHQRRDQLIVLLLGQLCMPPNINGYQYLREAVSLVSADVSLLRGMTHRLYPMVAEKFDSTASRVERSIRHAIETTVTKGNMEVIYHFFGNTLDPQKGKPTNGEFIAMLSEYVRVGL